MRVQSYRIEESGHVATLQAYILDASHKKEQAKRPGLLILPGGGYHYVSPREAEPVALKYLAEGFNCFVLHYSVAPEAVFPTALRQAAKAMQFIRERAEELMTDPRRVAVMGFSAGGHLAGSLGTMWNDASVTDVVPAADARPDALLLCYAVITSGEHANRPSIDNLLGDRKSDAAALERVSLENRVHPAVPPTFLWHTFEDTCVPVQNSLLFASALRENDVPFEMHIFPDGGHGLSVATEETDSDQPRCADWVSLSIKWLKGLK